VADHTFSAKMDAQVWLSTIDADIRRGAWVDPAGGRMSVAELADRWLHRDPSKRSSTTARDATILRLHVLPTLGRRRLHDVTPPELQALINVWAKDQAPRTVDRQYDVLRAMFT
jgi:hypothetical protein